VRKYLGVWAGVAALCVISWAQAPAPTAAPTPDSGQAPVPAQAPTPTQTPAPEPAPIPTPAATRPPALLYPRYELFGGGSYAETGFFNAGHWAGLPGYEVSLGLNATSWFGVVVDGGEYFGTSKIPSNSPAPFPGNQNYLPPPPSPTFNVSTREYNFLFGLQFARRKYGRWTPTAEIMYGHQGTRGIATPVIPGPRITEVGTGRALVAGIGADRTVTPRIALRFKGEYLQTGTAFLLQHKQTQDNFRFSVGIVIRNVHKRKRRLEDETQTEP